MAGDAVFALHAARRIPLLRRVQVMGMSAYGRAEYGRLQRGPAVSLDDGRGTCSLNPRLRSRSSTTACGGSGAGNSWTRSVRPAPPRTARAAPLRPRRQHPAREPSVSGIRMARLAKTAHQLEQPDYGRWCRAERPDESGDREGGDLRTDVLPAAGERRRISARRGAVITNHTQLGHPPSLS